MLDDDELEALLDGCSVATLLFADTVKKQIGDVFELWGFYPEVGLDLDILTDKQWQNRLKENIKHSVDDLNPQELYPVLKLIDTLNFFSRRRLKRKAAAAKRLKTMRERASFEADVSDV